MSVAFLLPSLTHGGAERVVIALASAFADRGYDTHLILGVGAKDLAGGAGALRTQVPANVKVHLLEKSRTYQQAAPLAALLRRERFDCLISSLGHTNAMAAVARAIAGVDTKLISVQHNHLTEEARRGANLQWKLLPLFYRLLVSRSDAIVGVSQGVVDDLAKLLPRHKRIRRIYNPVIGADFAARLAAEPERETKLMQRRPLFVAAGRLSAAKDYPTLLRAFAKLRARRQCGLLILGDGDQRAELEALADTLGIADDVEFMGFVMNPIAYMARADAFVLSSAWEGFAIVLVEALGAGLRVVSTDCPSGPAEIINNPQLGVLTPVGDDNALAEAMETSLNRAHDPEVARARARDFAAEHAAAQYEALVLEVLAGKQAARGA